jgi:hypothetical protein
MPVERSEMIIEKVFFMFSCCMACVDGSKPFRGAQANNAPWATHSLHLRIAAVLIAKPANQSQILSTGVECTAYRHC